ncbi:MAG: hypothetical protein KDJ47_08505 [Hyphomicrobiaceae bacterium]|nr:hypothetical protein [Hyphomicrobiaceae bacterium]
MSRMKGFNANNPTGEMPGIEPVRLDVLRATVDPAPVPKAPAPVAMPQPVQHLVSKHLRLPADIVDYIDYVYTKDNRMKKQDAYTLAIEAYFRPLMKR